MGSTTNNNISLTYDEVVHNKIRSLDIIEEQITNALSIIPTCPQPIKAAKTLHEEFIDLFRELRCILGFAVGNIKTFKRACSNEGSFWITVPSPLPPSKTQDCLVHVMGVSLYIV